MIVHQGVVDNNDEGLPQLQHLQPVVLEKRQQTRT